MVTPNDMLEEITLMVDNSRKDWEKVIGIVKACQEKGMSPEETGEQIMRGMFPCHYTDNSPVGSRLWGNLLGRVDRHHLGLYYIDNVAELEE